MSDTVATRFQRGVVAAATTATVVATAGAYLLLRPSVDSGGPLASQEAVEWCAPAGDDDAVTWGAVTLTNRTDEPITLNSVDPTGVSGGATVTDILVAPISDTTLVGMLSGWQPPADVEPVDGWTITPGDTANVVARVSLDSAAGRVDGLKVDYRHGGRHYSDTHRAALVVLESGRTC